MTRNCNYCKNPYTRRPSVVGKFCSNVCKGKGNLEQQKNLTYRIPKGNVPHNKGNGRADFVCPNCGKINSFLISQVKKGFCDKKCFDEFQTTDEPKTYGGIHNWVKRKFGTPSKCEHCGTDESKKFEWANVSGRYMLVRNDWARLCCKCHRRYDLGTKNRIEVLNGTN